MDIRPLLDRCVDESLTPEERLEAKTLLRSMGYDKEVSVFVSAHIRKMFDELRRSHGEEAVFLAESVVEEVTREHFNKPKPEKH